MKKTLVISALASLLLSQGAFAVEILKTEPGKGKLKDGAVIFVDDGSCGKGKVKRLVGGNKSTGVGRTSTCVATPK